MKRASTVVIRDERQGSTLLIVLSLLGLLTLLGLIFFTFANQERASAEYFSAAAKGEPSEPDDGFDFGLQQLLIGPNDFQPNSVLYGRHSMVANLVGLPRATSTDLRPHTGSGVNMIYWDDGTGNIRHVVDQNRDGQPDGGAGRPSIEQLRNVVDSPVAHGGIIRQVFQMPAPDNGVTYPDANSMFLSYKGFAYRQAGPNTELVPVVIPSFMRPGLFRQGTEESVTDPNWQVTAYDGSGNPINTHAGSSFRPHRAHIYMQRNGATVGDPPVRRFIDEDHPGDAALIAGGALPGGSGGFPFTIPAAQDLDGNTANMALGIWTATPAEIANGTADPYLYELDVDNDGDGIRDAIWIDLDHPVLEDPETGAKYTYLYAFTVKDMEALINVNVHGNLSGDLDDWSENVGGIDPDIVAAGLARPFTTGSLTRSNSGMTPSEVNPIYALMRDPNLSSDPASDFEQHRLFYGPRNGSVAPHHAPLSAMELANMELFWLLMGRPELDNGTALTSALPASAITDLYAGRFGEPDLLFRQLTQTSNLADFFYQVIGTSAFSSPKPGRALADDNNDVWEGTGSFGMRGLTSPLAFDGAGRSYPVADPRIPLLRQVSVGGNGTRAVAPQYIGYSLFSETGDLTDVLLGSNQLHYRGEDGVIGTADDLVGQARLNTLFDEMNETLSELEKTPRPADEVFGASETTSLHVSDGDLTLGGDQFGERLRKLLVYSAARRENRERLTATSWGFREHAFGVPFPPNIVTPFGRDGMPGWAGEDDDGDGQADFYDWNGNGRMELEEVDWDEVGSYDPGARFYSEDGFRAWMFSADSVLFSSSGTPNGRFEFPPRYGSSSVEGAGASPSRGFDDGSGNALPFESREINAGITNEDPFRPQLRRLMRLEAGDRTETFGQLPLSINRFLDVERLPDRPADLIRGTLEYRALTEHVDSLQADGTTNGEALTTQVVTKGPFPPREDLNANDTLADEIEYWARRDRQKMARDIYVLLYTLGGGDDSVNYAGSNLELVSGGSGQPPTTTTYKFYTQDQLRQMAQFAVNMVDALDRDNVSTRFEYDKNLGDTIDANTGEVIRTGWNLDDDTGPGLSNGDSVSVTEPEAASLSSDVGFVKYDRGNNKPAGYGGGYDANFPEDSAERGVVYGVERQDLSFSEVLAVFQQEFMDDHDATLHEDDEGSHAFLHIELQNHSSQAVPLSTPQSTSEEEGIYRIRAFNNSTPVNDNHDWATRQNRHQRVTFLRDAPDVEPGGVLTIATSGGNDQDPLSANAHRPSDLYIDTDGSGTFDRISPAVNLGAGLPSQTTPATNMVPQATIDLVHARDRNGVDVFSVNGASPGTEGAFLTENGGNGGPPIFDPTTNNVPEAQVLVLERRANPHMPQLSLLENPWIEVDRTFVFFEELDIDPGSDPTAAQMDALTSTFRGETLEAQLPNAMARTTPAFPRANTIGSEAESAQSASQTVQPRFDRDFTSVGELVQIPLYGPGSLTSQLRDSLRVPSSASASDQFERSNSPPPAGAVTGLDQNSTVNRWVLPYGSDREPGQGLVSGANAKFLMANFPDTEDGGTTAAARAPGLSNADLDNRWYLLFGALEVPTRAHRQLGNPLVNLKRKPGPINVNTLRHPEVLMGLLDEPLVTDLDFTATGVLNESGFASAPMPDALGEANRDWMQQLIASRDGQFTPASNAHTLYIPGLPGSRPFTPFGRFAAADYSLVRNGSNENYLDRHSVNTRVIDQENTLLRSLSLDVADTDGDGIDDNNSARRLFEIGQPADFESDGVSNNVVMTPQSRHRLLSKVLNNATTSSNTFVVHVTIGLFEVYEDPGSGAVRIGGEFDRDQDGDAVNDRRRGVFLIDRSEITDAYDPGSGQFDYRRLIKHGVKLQE